MLPTLHATYPTCYLPNMIPTLHATYPTWLLPYMLPTLHNSYPTRFLPNMLPTLHATYMIPTYVLPTVHQYSVSILMTKLLQWRQKYLDFLTIRLLWKPRLNWKLFWLLLSINSFRRFKSFPTNIYAICLSKQIVQKMYLSLNLS